jgi:N utilization substance protein B
MNKHKSNKHKKKFKSDNVLHARRAAMWLLYSVDVAGHSPAEALATSKALIMEHEPDAASSWEHVEQRVLGVTGKLTELDEELQRLSPRWRIDRMAVVDRTILRLGAWELLERGGRSNATIQGCVELAKEYGEHSSRAFVNGILDQLRRDSKIELS